MGESWGGDLWIEYNTQTTSSGLGMEGLEILSTPTSMIHCLQNITTEKQPPLFAGVCKNRRENSL